MKVDIKIEEQFSPLTQIKSLNQLKNILLSRWQHNFVRAMLFFNKALIEKYKIFLHHRSLPANLLIYRNNKVRFHASFKS